MSRGGAMKTAAKAASVRKAEGIPPRERIVAVAADLFYRHGIRAVGVEAIAEAAGTNKMTLYRHFASKDELVAEYLRQSAKLADELHLLLEGARVTAQSVGANGLGARLVRMGEAMIAAHAAKA